MTMNIMPIQKNKAKLPVSVLSSTNFEKPATNTPASIITHPGIGAICITFEFSVLIFFAFQKVKTSLTIVQTSQKKNSITAIIIPIFNHLGKGPDRSANIG